MARTYSRDLSIEESRDTLNRFTHPAVTTSAAPTSSSDSSAGYKVGDIWVDTRLGSLGNIYWMCHSASVGAAVWQAVSWPDFMCCRAKLGNGADTVLTPNSYINCPPEYDVWQDWVTNGLPIKGLYFFQVIGRLDALADQKGFWFRLGTTQNSSDLAITWHRSSSTGVYQFIETGVGIISAGAKLWPQVNHSDTVDRNFVYSVSQIEMYLMKPEM